MGLEGLNIFSVQGFTFFLLVLATGYYCVEIMLGKYYFLRHIFKNYDNNIFDRIIHYILWGLLVNIGMIGVTFSNSKLLDSMVNLFNSLDKVGKIFNPENPLSVQIVLFSFGYFILIMMLLISATFCIQIFGKLISENQSDKKIRKIHDKL